MADTKGVYKINVILACLCYLCTVVWFYFFEWSVITVSLPPESKLKDQAVTLKNEELDLSEQKSCSTGELHTKQSSDEQRRWFSDDQN